jgi:hypothetical protein
MLDYSLKRSVGGYERLKLGLSESRMFVLHSLFMFVARALIEPQYAFIV